MELKLPRRLRDPFTALLLFGAAGIMAMILAFAITSLPRLGGTAAPAGVTGQQAVTPPSPPSPSPIQQTKDKGHGHGHGGGG